MKRLDKIKIIIGAASIFIIVLAGALLFAVKKGPIASSASVSWGITYSKIQAVRMGLDWQVSYIEILDGLNVKNLRIPVYWNDVEEVRDNYDFSDYTWMSTEAAKRNISTVLVIGRRTPRWPECHIPPWVSVLDQVSQDKALLDFIQAVVTNFKSHPNISAWQVENEPFLSTFGECPKTDPGLLRKEVEIVKTMDPSRPVIITDSGELGDWLRAAKHADIFGTTMYRKVGGWGPFKYATYPLPAQFYRWKANLISHFVPINKLIVSELQGEPWVIGTPTASDKPLEEQYETVNPEYFKEIVKYAKDSGIGEIYWWGAEWWYWLKLNGHTEIWETAKELFNS